MRTRLVAAAGLAAGLTAGAAAGLALGVPGTSGAQPGTEGVERTEEPAREAVRADRAEHLAGALAPLVEDGTLTQEQADAVVARLQEAGPGPGAHLRGPGLPGGPDLPGVPGGPGGPGAGPLGLDAAAEAIDIPVEDLHDALRQGRSLAEVAEANGVSGDAVVDALVADLSERLDERVAAGELTREEADEHLADAAERIAERIDQVPPSPPGGFGERRGPGPRGEGGEDGAEPAVATRSAGSLAT